MKSRQFIIFILSFLFVIPFAYPQVASPEDQRLQQIFYPFVLKQIKRERIPGLSIGYLRLGKDGDTQWNQGFGFADLENQVPTSPGSSFRLGSVSKMMTAVAALQLAEKGKMDLDAEVQKYVPYFPKKKWPVTIRELLGHLAGISHYKDYDVEGRIKEHKSTKEAVSIFADWDLVAEPGTKFSYSSYGYNLLAAAIEGAAGEPFGDYMRKNVWEPAGMRNTRMDDPADLIPRRVRGYRLIEGKIKNSEFVDMSSRLGAGGVRSTIPDLLLFVKHLNDGTLLSPASRETMFSSMTQRDGRLTGYGMGWDISSMNGRQFFYHTGSQQETRTAVYYFPSRNLIIAVAINQEDVGASLYARKLFQVLEGESWNISAYTGDEKSDAIFAGMKATFESGMSHFDRFGKPAKQDADAVRKAFKYFNDALSEKNLDAKKPELNIDDGVEPFTGEPLTVVGSFIASKLAEKGKDPLQRYPKLGAIPFLNDYQKLYQQDSSIAKDFRFSEELEKRLQTWNESWTRTNTEEVRALWITADADFNQLSRLLKNQFSNAAVFPDLTSQFSNSVLECILSFEPDRALAAAELAIQTYPKSESAAAGKAVALLATKSTDSAAIQQSLKASSVDTINDLAESLFTYGNPDLALDLINAAVQAYPSSSPLYDSLGELYKARNEPQKAIDAFRKGMELDPKNADLKEKLDKLQKVSPQSH